MARPASLRAWRSAPVLLAMPFVQQATAEPLRPEEIPPPLGPLVDWVLAGHERKLCPFLNGVVASGEAGPTRICAWPARLELDLEDRRGRFSQGWLVQQTTTWVPLASDAEHWPHEVRVGQEPQTIFTKSGRPGIELSPGRHIVTDEFRWSRLPELLRIPSETGLVRLTLCRREAGDVRFDVTRIALAGLALASLLTREGELWRPLQRPRWRRRESTES